MQLCRRTDAALPAGGGIADTLNIQRNEAVTLLQRNSSRVYISHERGSSGLLLWPDFARSALLACRAGSRTMATTWASRVALVVGLTVLLAALLSSSGRLLRQPMHVTTIRTTSTRAPVAPGARVQQEPAAALEETLGAVRGQVGSLRTLVARTQAASLALKERLRSEPSAAPSDRSRARRHRLRDGCNGGRGATQRRTRG